MILSIYLFISTVLSITYMLLYYRKKSDVQYVLDDNKKMLKLIEAVDETDTYLESAKFKALKLYDNNQKVFQLERNISNLQNALREIDTCLDASNKIYELEREVQECSKSFNKELIKIDSEAIEARNKIKVEREKLQYEITEAEDDLFQKRKELEALKKQINKVVDKKRTIEKRKESGEFFVNAIYYSAMDYELEDYVIRKMKREENCYIKGYFDVFNELMDLYECGPDIKEEFVIILECSDKNARALIDDLCRVCKKAPSYFDNIYLVGKADFSESFFSYIYISLKEYNALKKT